MLQFILERYNYWIVIILMMTGLYIVFSRGNLVKKIIGLNIFQTSVFIFYITIGKIAGGTAPIFIGGHGGEGDHGDEGGHGDKGVHGDDLSHGEKASDHATEGLTSGEQLGENANDILKELHNGGGVAATSPGEIDLGAALQGDSLHSKVTGQFSDVPKNELADLLSAGGNVDEVDGSIHNLPQVSDKISNSVLSDAKAALTPNSVPDLEHDVADIAEGLVIAAEKADVSHGADIIHHGGDATAEIIYSNPLPHVLILTAIVVGVATTAVGLALAVRIREAYGTIEEDELEAADDIAEFGDASYAQEAH